MARGERENGRRSEADAPFERSHAGGSCLTRVALFVLLALVWASLFLLAVRTLQPGLLERVL